MKGKRFMTSKERVRAVIDKKMPDRVPWGEWAVDFDTVGKVIGRPTYYRAKAKSQMAFWEGRRDEVVRSWIEDGIAFFQKMACFDIINIAAMAGSIAPPKGYRPEAPRKVDDNTWVFTDGTVYKYSDITADLTKIFDPKVGRKQCTPADFDKAPVVNPVDESFGDHFACMGGIPVETLVSGTPEDVRRDVRFAMEHYKEGGRWIFGSTHSIAVGTSYDNFMAMVDEFVKLRDY